MLLWRVIAIRAQFIRHVEWKSVSNLEQELICLPDGPQFILARSPILLDGDFLHASLFQRIEQLLPIRCSLAERCILRKIARDGRRKRRGPFFHMGEFKSMWVLFKIRIGVATTGDEIDRKSTR